MDSIHIKLKKINHVYSYQFWFWFWKYIFKSNFLLASDGENEREPIVHSNPLISLALNYSSESSHEEEEEEEDIGDEESTSKIEKNKKDSEPKFSYRSGSSIPFPEFEPKGIQQQQQQQPKQLNFNKSNQQAKLNIWQTRRWYQFFFFSFFFFQSILIHSLMKP